MRRFQRGRFRLSPPKQEEGLGASSPKPFIFNILFGWGEDLNLRPFRRLIRWDGKRVNHKQLYRAGQATRRIGTESER